MVFVNYYYAHDYQKTFSFVTYDLSLDPLGAEPIDLHYRLSPPLLLLHQLALLKKLYVSAGRSRLRHCSPRAWCVMTRFYDRNDSLAAAITTPHTGGGREGKL